MNRWAERRLAGATAVSNRSNEKQQRHQERGEECTGGQLAGRGLIIACCMRQRRHRERAARQPTAQAAAGQTLYGLNRLKPSAAVLTIRPVICGGRQSRDRCQPCWLSSSTPPHPGHPPALPHPPAPPHRSAHLRVPVHLLHVVLPAVHKQQLRRQVVGRQGIGLRRQRSLLLCTGKPGRHAGPARRVNDGRALAWPGAAPNVALPAAPRSMQAAPPSPAAAYPPSSLPCQLSPPALPHPPPPATQTPTPHNHRQPRRSRHTPGRRPLPAHPGPAPGPGPTPPAGCPRPWWPAWRPRAGTTPRWSQARGGSTGWPQRRPPAGFAGPTPAARRRRRQTPAGGRAGEAEWAAGPTGCGGRLLHA